VSEGLASQCPVHPEDGGVVFSLSDRPADQSEVRLVFNREADANRLRPPNVRDSPPRAAMPCGLMGPRQTRWSASPMRRSMAVLIGRESPSVTLI
jgi:hypothetical protein